MIKFLLGCFVGGAVGMFATCLCVAAGRADRELNCTDSEDEFQ